jgi:hypothetical protein
MTAPVSAGYPDWGRQASEAQVLEINDTGVVGNGVQIYPIRYIGNAKELYVLANPSTFGCNFNVSFYADAGGIEVLGSHSIHCQQSDIARQPLPILGPYMGASVFPSGGGNFSYSFLVWRTPAPGTLIGVAGDIVVFGQTGSAIAGTGGVTLLSPNVTEGPISWSFFMTGGNYIATLFARDYVGNKTPLDRVDNATASRDRRTLWVPPQTIQIDITNNNAAAQTFDLFMSRKHNT